MSVPLAIRTNQTGRRTVHRPLRVQGPDGRPPSRLPTSCGWYGDLVYSSLGDADLADVSRCRRCWPDPEARR